MGSITKDQIYNLIGLDKVKRVAMARYFGRLSEVERIEAFRFAYDLAKQNMEKADDDIRGKPEFFYSMFCLSMWKMNWVREALTKKNPNLTEEQSKEISKRRIDSVLSARKDRVKRGRLITLFDVRLYHVVKDLRKQGASWRECAKYVKKYHKTQISHVHLHKIYRKITAERTLRGEE